MNLPTIVMLATLLPLGAEDPPRRAEYDPSPEHPFGRPNPEAPAELAQFAHLVGEHVCEERLRDPGGPWRTARGRWRGRWILNGWVLADEYIGSTYSYLGVRVYLPAEARWSISFFQTPQPDGPALWTGRSTDSGMVVERPIELPDGAAATIRLSFSDVTNAGFRWRNETISERGSLTTWTLECRRRIAP